MLLEKYKSRYLVLFKILKITYMISHYMCSGKLFCWHLFQISSMSVVHYEIVHWMNILFVRMVYSFSSSWTVRRIIIFAITKLRVHVHVLCSCANISIEFIPRTVIAVSLGTHFLNYSGIASFSSQCLKNLLWEYKFLIVPHHWST